MLQDNPIITGISYVLGAEERDYLEIDDFSTIAASYQMAQDAKLWGWGKFRRSAVAAIEMSIGAGRQTLRLSGMPAGDVDTVIFCATQFPAGVESHADCCRRLIDVLGLRDVFVLGLTLNRCATMLSALILASDLVRSRERSVVLVVSGDKVCRENERFQKFAIFSDGAASCIITTGASASTGYAVLAGATATDVPSMRADGEINPRLAREVNEKIRQRSGIGPEQIRLVLHNNMFTPLVRMKEQQAKFRPDQLFLDNIAGKGHCFGADPLINLADSAAQGLTVSGDHLLLASSTPGMRAAMLIKQT